MGDLGSVPGLGRPPGARERLPTPVFYPGEFHELYSPWSNKESDMTEQLSGEELETLNMDAAPLVPFSLSRLVSDSCAVDLW